VTDEGVRDLAGAVAWLSAEPARTALFTDFDGTLSPIVARPELARPLPGAVEALKHLASSLAVVGVVSGRPVGFLADRLDLGALGPAGPATAEKAPPGLHAYGLHGLEHRSAAGVVEIEPAVLTWRDSVAAAGAGARLAALPGVEVEDKVYGVTMHWRNAPDPAEAEAQVVPLADEIAALNGLHTRPGKASVELVPPVGVDKGTIVRRWAEDARIGRIGFLGDDVSDLLAFDALDVASAGDRIRALKVAVTGPDAPPGLIESADLVLGSPAEAVELLCRLAESVGAR
jgi:trehalose 6-phosphate phosphatase